MTSARFATLSALFLAGLCAPASAQTTYTWNGGGADGNWSNGANWGGTAPPSSLTDTLLTFAGSTNLNTTIDSFPWASTFQVRGLTFANNTSSFLIDSTGATLEVGVDGIATSGGSVTHVISAPVRLGADQTWSSPFPTLLRITGPVDLGSHTLNATGAWVEVAGVISGTGRLDPSRIILSAANTYSGGTLVDAGGWIQATSAASFGSGLVDLRGNSTITITAAGDATLAGGLQVTNTNTNDINRLQINHDQAVVRLPAGGLTGTGTLSREGTGTLILTGANAFSGTLYTGSGGRMELIDTGGGASLNANSYNIYVTTFHVGPGAVLLNNRPVVADLGGRVEFEQSQTLSGLAVGLSTSPVNNNNAIIAPNVTLTVSGYVTGSSGTLNANITGFLLSGFSKTGTGTLVMSGNSDFVGQTSITGGVLSIDTIANHNQPSAIGASDELFMSAGTTLRYTGTSASTDRKLTLSSTATSPATIEVTNAATVLSWTGPINIGNTRSFAKTGAGTLLIASRSSTSLGTATIKEGTVTVTGTGGLTTASTIVQSGATLGGALTAPGANLNVSGAVTIQSGGTLRAGIGGSSDHFGVGAATVQSGTTFIVTADGGAFPSSSRLTTEGGGAATVNFQTSAASPITLRIEKGTGTAFTPNSVVTLEIVHTNDLTGSFSFPNKVLRGGSPFTYVATEWNIQTSGFDIVPGSAFLLTDVNKTTLSVQFIVAPEPASILGLASAAAALVAAGWRMRRLTLAGSS